MSAVHNACIGILIVPVIVTAPELEAADEPQPNRTLLRPAQGIGLAAGQNRGDPRPEELRPERGDEGRNAETRDEQPVDESHEHAGQKCDGDGEPAELVFLEQYGEHETRKGDD